jgi:hypothetical protein
MEREEPVPRSADQQRGAGGETTLPDGALDLDVIKLFADTLDNGVWSSSLG